MGRREATSGATCLRIHLKTEKQWGEDIEGNERRATSNSQTLLHIRIKPGKFKKFSVAYSRPMMTKSASLKAEAGIVFF